jgi:hypothetical protein
MNKLIKKIFIEKAKIDREIAKIDAEIEIMLLDKVVNINDLENDYTKLSMDRQLLRLKHEVLEDVLRWIAMD